MVSLDRKHPQKGGGDEALPKQSFGKLGQYRAESDHKAERDPRTQASRACPFAEKEEQGSGRMASFSPKAKKKPEQSGLCSDVAGAVSLDLLSHGEG